MEYLGKVGCKIGAGMLIREPRLLTNRTFRRFTDGCTRKNLADELDKLLRNTVLFQELLAMLLVAKRFRSSSAGN